MQRNRRVSDEDLAELADFALIYGMRIGEDSEAARVLAQRLAKQREEQEAALARALGFSNKQIREERERS